jgi:hypothetical protein
VVQQEVPNYDCVYEALCFGAERPDHVQRAITEFCELAACTGPLNSKKVTEHALDGLYASSKMTEFKKSVDLNYKTHFDAIKSLPYTEPAHAQEFLCTHGRVIDHLRDASRTIRETNNAPIHGHVYGMRSLIAREYSRVAGGMIVCPITELQNAKLPEKLVPVMASFNENQGRYPLGKGVFVKRGTNLMCENRYNEFQRRGLDTIYRLDY